jgi:3-methyl-2-oxobutanoate hydroxymethyltransferase
MPWLSYHVTTELSVLNAGRMIREGGAEAVKLEGGRKRLPMIESVLAAEIPVMGHLGLTPQSVNAMGGYRVQGKGLEAARDLLEDALALSDAGVFSIVLEGVPDALATLITEEVPVPTIGIGAGPHCDGQVLVFHDVLGLHDGRLPRFVRKYAELGEVAVGALEEFFTDIRKGGFPAEEESYANTVGVAAALREERRSSGD